MELERINMRDESYQASVQEIHRCGKLCFHINQTEPHSEEGRNGHRFRQQSGRKLYFGGVFFPCRGAVWGGRH